MKRMYAVFVVCCLTAISAGAQAPDAGWINLTDAAAQWKAGIAYDPFTGSGHILRGSDLVRFKRGFPVFALGSDRSLHAEAIRDNGSELQIQKTTQAALNAWFNEKSIERASHFRIAAIIIDPGHGGKDPGAVGEFGSGKTKFKIQEKDVALSVGKDLYTRLVSKWPSKQILITRSGDTYPSLDDRVDMANEVSLGINEAIIYVSIHANASFNTAASGFEVWYLNPEYRRPVLDSRKTKGVDKQVLPILNSMLEEEYTTESVFLAKSIVSGLSGTVGAVSKNRGVLAEEWFVVRNAKMPSVLVEVGFVTNETEAKRLADQAYLHKVSDGIYNGVVDFVDYFENRKGAQTP